MKIGIDASKFNSRTHSHEQVLMNLLKGFNDNGVFEDIYILCFKSRLSIYKSLIPKAHFKVIPGFYIEDKLKNKPQYILKRLFN